jgi:hypothetical protein
MSSAVDLRDDLLALRNQFGSQFLIDRLETVPGVLSQCVSG